MRYTLDDLLAFMCGAGVVYTFWLILDLISGSGFRTWFFFLYWNCMFLFILFLRWLKQFKISQVNSTNSKIKHNKTTKHKPQHFKAKQVISKQNMKGGKK